jgi:Xaa-Pro aminopeptidase
VTALLLYGSTESADLFHTLPVHIFDPFPYLETEEGRWAVIPRSDADKLAGTGVEAVDPAELERDELLASGMPDWDVDIEMVVKLCQRERVSSVTVPVELPVGVADRLRAVGIEVTVDAPTFFERRRRKTPDQLAGIRRAQKAADAAMGLAAELIRGADGSLTSEEVRGRLQALCHEHGCDLPDDVIVAAGAQGAVGHEAGHGPLAPGEPVIVDIWPRDHASSCWADMTRTFIAGGGEPDAEIARWHELTIESIESVIAAIRPGASCRELYELSCEPYHRDGHPTQLTKQPGQVLVDGYWWALGHGVGLEVHERPYLGRSTDVLVEGDVVAIEPGCVRYGFGSARLEDLVLVTADGAEVLTDFPYDLQ